MTEPLRETKDLRRALTTASEEPCGVEYDLGERLLPEGVAERLYARQHPDPDADA